MVGIHTHPSLPSPTYLRQPHQPRREKKNGKQKHNHTSHAKETKVSSYTKRENGEKESQMVEKGVWRGASENNTGNRKHRK